MTFLGEKGARMQEEEKRRQKERYRALLAQLGESTFARIERALKECEVSEGVQSEESEGVERVDE